MKPHPCSTAARANAPALYRPLAVALWLSCALLSACGGGNGQTPSADAKAPQMRCAS